MARIPTRVDREVWHKAKQFVAALRKRGLQIHSAYLYGSQAKGTAHEWSDIDIAIVAHDLSDDWGQNFLTLTRIAHDIDLRIEPVGYIPRNFRDESPLVWEIKSTGIPLLGNGQKSNRRAPSRQPRVKHTKRA